MTKTKIVTYDALKFYDQDIKEYISDQINEPLIETTYSVLLALRDGNNLKRGRYYRITDYVTTTVQSNYYKSAGHPFDIIVLALSNNTLSEEAYAALHAGDTYFANSNLSAWKLKYCLDNDSSRFIWATATGKGVIYHMEDESGNICSYDFKNIQFIRYGVTGLSSTDTNIAAFLSDNTANFFLNDTNIKMYTMPYGGYTIITIDAENVAWQPLGIAGICSWTFGASKWFYTFSDIVDGEVIDTSLTGATRIYNNTLPLAPFTASNPDGSFPIQLNDNVFIGTDIYNNIFTNRAYRNTFICSMYGNTFNGEVKDNIFTSERGFTFNIFNESTQYNIFFNKTSTQSSMHNVFNSLGSCWFSGLICYNQFNSGLNKGNIYNYYTFRNNFGPEIRYTLFPRRFNQNNVEQVCYLTIKKPDDNELRNHHFGSSLQGTASTRLEVTCTTQRNYDVNVSKNSAGTVVQWCPADIASIANGNDTTY